jgi:hypothetical protein
MKRNCRHSLLSTTMGAFLSLTIQVERNGQSQLFTWPLLPLTTWVWIGWQLYLWFRQGRSAVETCLSLVYQRLAVWRALTQIGYKSILYGVGVMT